MVPNYYSLELLAYDRQQGYRKEAERRLLAKQIGRNTRSAYPERRLGAQVRHALGQLLSAPGRLTGNRGARPATGRRTLAGGLPA